MALLLALSCVRSDERAKPPVSTEADADDGCGGAVSFVAPAAATHTFDTVGVGFDTTLAASDGCGGAELACDSPALPFSAEVQLTLAAGQEVVLVVDGGFDPYSAVAGPFRLDVR